MAKTTSKYPNINCSFFSFLTLSLVDFFLCVSSRLSNYLWTDPDSGMRSLLLPAALGWSSPSFDNLFTNMSPVLFGEHLNYTLLFQSSVVLLITSLSSGNRNRPQSDDFMCWIITSDRMTRGSAACKSKCAVKNHSWCIVQRSGWCFVFY